MTDQTSPERPNHADSIAAAIAAQTLLVASIRRNTGTVSFTALSIDRYGDLTIQARTDESEPIESALAGVEWRTDETRGPSECGWSYRSRVGTWIGVTVRFAQELPPAGA